MLLQSWSLVSSRKFKCKEWDWEFTKLHNSPRPAACWSRIKRQYHKWQIERLEGGNLCCGFSSTPLVVPSKIIREVIQRNANEIEGRSSKESLKLSSNFCLLRQMIRMSTSKLYCFFNCERLLSLLSVLSSVLVLITKDKNLWVVKTVKRRGRKLIL